MKLKEYNALVNEFSDRLYRFILKSLRDTEASHDIVQDAFMKLWENRQKIIEGQAKAWLYTTAYNTMINHIKKHKRSKYVEDVQIYDGRGVSQDQLEHRDLLDKGLKELSELYRSILLLRDYEGYDYKSIGTILELNESQVKVYLFRARKKMKEVITELSKESKYEN